MRTISLQDTSLSASRLGFGLSGLHHLLRPKGRQDLLSAAFDNGITYFDTAPYYGHGLAERELGLFASGRRDRIVVATKFGIPPNPWFERFPQLMYSRLATDAALRRITGRRGFAVKRTLDYSVRNAINSVNRSLRALRTDYVDVLYLHEPTLDQLAEPDRLIQSLAGLQSSGKVRYFGLAGNVRDCLSILDRHAGFRGLLQMNAGRGEQELDILNAASIAFHSSYGHFRDKTGSVSDALAAAIGANRHGVILFSTRRSERIRTMVQLLDTLEAA